MKSSVFLVLLPLLFEASVQEVEKPQRHDDVQENELKELRNMVLEQHEGIQILKEKLSEQAAALKSTQDELSAANNLLETVKLSENSALSSQLTAFESRMAQVEKTLEDNAQQPKVAFSVGLTNSGQVGPFSVVKTLVYNKIFYNLGGAYNTITGIFTAPKKGVYYFIYIGYSNQAYFGGLDMYHNRFKISHRWGPKLQATYFPNAVTRQMEAGDVLYMQIPSGYTVYDDPSNYCTLTGFLLYIL